MTRKVTILHGTEAAPVKVVVDGWTTRDAPGLAVTKHQYSNWYVVSHLSSGRIVGPYVYKSRAAAVRAMRKLAAVTDWPGFVFAGKDSFPVELKEACRSVAMSEGKHEWDAFWGGAS